MRTRFAATLGALALGAVSLLAQIGQTTLPSPFVAAPVAVPIGAAQGSAQPNLAADDRGEILVSWLEAAAPENTTFRFARVNAAGVPTAPATIVSGANLLANWADFPSMYVARNGTIAAHWLERGPTRAAYGIRVSTSTDGGRKWTTPVTPHSDGIAAGEHGFVSFFDSPAAGLGLIWLDGRETVSGRGGAMALRAAPLDKSGAAGGETIVDARVCDCCQTSASRTGRGAIVAYRDRTDQEIRDIVVSRFENGAWTSAMTVGADNWEINGCPVNGPSIAASDNDVAVAWFSAAGNAPKTQIAFSSDGGKTFGAPIRIDATTTLGRTSVAMIGAGRALVSSVERASPGAQIVVREVRRDGEMSAPIVIGRTAADRTSGFPHIAASNGRVVIAWTEVASGVPSQVRVVHARIRP